MINPSFTAVRHDTQCSTKRILCLVCENVCKLSEPKARTGKVISDSSYFAKCLACVCSQCWVLFSNVLAEGQSSHVAILCIFCKLSDINAPRMLAHGDHCLIIGGSLPDSNSGLSQTRLALPKKDMHSLSWVPEARPHLPRKPEWLLEARKLTSCFWTARMAQL